MSKSKVGRLDVKTGQKLRRLNREQCETAEQIYMAMESERALVVRGPADEAVPDGHVHKGPVRLSQPMWQAWRR